MSLRRSQRLQTNIKETETDNIISKKRIKSNRNKKIKTKKNIKK